MIPLAAQTPIRCFDVVIVGAGAAGLECALSLLTASPLLKVVILEARDRVGGRIHTTLESALCSGDDEPKSFVYDHGAAWVHGTEPGPDGVPNPMLDYVTVKSEYVEVAPGGNPWTRPRSILHGKDCIYLYQDGRHVTDDFEQSLAEHERRMKHVRQCAHEMLCTGNGIDASQCSVVDRLPDMLHPTSNLLADFYFHLISMWNGCEALKELQLAKFADEEIDDDHFTPQGDFPGPHCTLRSGMGGIISSMLNKQNLEETIQLEHVVTRISRDLSEEVDHPVTVETAENGKFQAKACVLTLPIGCIQAKLKEGNFFESPLSESKIEACSYMEMGCYKKVLLTFRTIHWPSDRPFLGLVVSKPHPILGHCLFIDNLWALQQIPSLEAILVGSAAEWATEKPDELIRDKVLEFLKEALPPCDEQYQHDGEESSRWSVVSTHVTRWEEDPYSLGTYSHAKLGSLPRHNDALQAPEWNDRLFFAGEATVAEFEGSVHAALFSGRRVAGQLLESKWLKARAKPFGASF